MSHGRWRIVLFFLLALLGGVTCRIAAQPAAPRHDPGQIKSDLNRILSSSEFQPDAPSENIITRTVKWVGEKWGSIKKALQRVWDRLFGFSMHLKGAKGLQWVFMAVFILVASLLLSRLLRNLYLYREKKTAATRTVFDEAEEVDLSVREPDAWLQQAQEFAQNGDYRRAFRAVFLATLLTLDRGGVIEFVRSRTNGDYLRTLRSAGLRELSTTLSSFVIEFDLRWYGDRPTDENDYRRSLQHLEAIQTLLAAHTKAETANGNALASSGGVSGA